MIQERVLMELPFLGIHFTNVVNGSVLAIVGDPRKGSASIEYKVMHITNLGMRNVQTYLKFEDAEQYIEDFTAIELGKASASQEPVGSGF